jgi:hypothetical protein
VIGAQHDHLPARFDLNDGTHGKATRMGIIRGFRDTKALMRAPRIQLRSSQPSQMTLQPSDTPMTARPQATAEPQAIDFMPRPSRTGGGDAPSDDALTPIEGVTLDTYATVVRGIAAYNYDQSMLPGIAALHGIAADSWRRAHDGWNIRIQRDAAVARRFSDIYHGAP